VRRAGQGPFSTAPVSLAGMEDRTVWWWHVDRLALRAGERQVAHLKSFWEKSSLDAGS